MTLILAHSPDEILQCNCSICSKSGFRGVYYREGEVEISGALEGYVRTDMKDPCITMWRCRRCGILTHWTLLGAWPHDDVPRPDRMGVNARLLDAELTQGLPVHRSDGASQ
ncbi:MAG: GFA family protein [Sphingomicrobium sp.]